MFVDHDPARLAGLVTERWQVSDHQVRRFRTGPDVAAGAVRIEASGDGGLGVAGLRGLPGVLSARTAAGTVVITAAGAASDSVLRALLAADPPVHIRSVRPAAESGPVRPHAGPPGSGRRGEAAAS